MKYVCLRDDDTSFFTSVKELRDGYGEFWGKLPITLATIPFAHGSHLRMGDFDETPEIYASLQKMIEEKDVDSFSRYCSSKWMRLRAWETAASAEELSAYHKVYPVGDNKDLVAELRALIGTGKIEIAQHGVFHRYNEFGPEMLVDEMAFAAIRDGKEYLEKVFEQKIDIFIPPDNTIDAGCLKYVTDLQMSLFCSGRLRYSSVLRKFLDYVIIDPMTAKERVYRRLTRSFSPIYRVNGVFGIVSLTYDSFKSHIDFLERIFTQLEKCGFVAVGTHYTSFRQVEYRERYQDLLRRLSERGDVEFLTSSKYYKRLMESYYA